VDLQSGQVTWEQELYERFEYQSATPFFHTFEGNDAIIGLSFADESDAVAFHSAVASFASGGGVRLGGPPAPNRRPTNPAPVARSPPATPTTPMTAPAAAPASAPQLQRAPSSASSIHSSSGGGGSMIGGQSAFAGTGGAGSKRMANPKKKKGWFSRITEKMGLGEDEGGQDIVLSGPTGFRHESHIGWDPSNGFEIRNVCSPSPSLT
jgi:Wiskott-Aldrich syndrome protein